MIVGVNELYEIPDLNKLFCFDFILVETQKLIQVYPVTIFKFISHRYDFVQYLDFVLISFEIYCNFLFIALSRFFLIF